MAARRPIAAKKVWPRHRTKEEVTAAFDGATRSGAAARLNCSESSAYHLRRLYGLAPSARAGKSRPGRSQLTKAREMAVRSAMESSATWREAGKILGGVTRQRAEQLGRRYGVAPQLPRPVASAVAPETLGDLADWLDVLGATDVARLLDLSGKSFRRAVDKLHAAGRPIRTRALRRAVLALHRDGWTQNVIAATVDTVQGNVWRIIHA